MVEAGRVDECVRSQYQAQKRAEPEGSALLLLNSSGLMSQSDCDDVLCLRAFLALGHGEFHFLAFSQ